MKLQEMMENASRYARRERLQNPKVGKFKLLSTVMKKLSKDRDKESALETGEY